MSESATPMRQLLPPLVRPEVLIGAASPLWAYFTGAAMAGIAFWWMTRLLKPMGLEAIVGTAPGLPARVPGRQPSDLPGEAVAEALMDDVWPEVPVGGEAAPFGVVTLEAEVLCDPEIATDLASNEFEHKGPATAPKTPKGSRAGPRKAQAAGETKPH